MIFDSLRVVGEGGYAVIDALDCAGLELHLVALHLSDREQGGPQDRGELEYRTTSPPDWNRSSTPSEMIRLNSNCQPHATISGKRHNSVWNKTLLNFNPLKPCCNSDSYPSLTVRKSPPIWRRSLATYFNSYIESKPFKPTNLQLVPALSKSCCAGTGPYRPPEKKQAAGRI